MYHIKKSWGVFVQSNQYYLPNKHYALSKSASLAFGNRGGFYQLICRCDFTKIKKLYIHVNLMYVNTIQKNVIRFSHKKYMRELQINRLIKTVSIIL